MKGLEFPADLPLRARVGKQGFLVAGAAADGRGLIGRAVVGTTFEAPTRRHEESTKATAKVDHAPCGGRRVPGGALLALGAGAESPVVPIIGPAAC